MNKRDQFIGECIDYTHDGLGVVKHDNTTIFVKNLLLHETAKIEIIKVLKSYCVGRVVELQTPSIERIEPKCECFKQCGGCSLMHMSDQEQQSFKTNRVKETFLKIAHQDLRVNDCLMDQDPYHYRNKVQVPFGMQDGHIVSGFYKARTNDIINNDYCLIQNEFSNKVIKRIKELFEKYHIQPYDETTGKGLVRHIMIRYGFHTDQIMVCLILNGDKLPAEKALVESLCEIPGMTSITININKKRNNVMLGNQLRLLWGQSYITDSIGNVSYQISPLSFFQVNPIQTEKLYGKALEYAGLTGNETVWDLYCGIGTISLFLAQRAKFVRGVEIVPQAIDNARENAKINGIENVEFFVGKAEEVLPREYDKNGIYADVIVVDPPRKGCDEALLNTILKLKPERVVYVSCDSATLARDLKILCAEEYELKRVSTTDMFPQSTHVETVVLLSKGEVDSKKIRVEFSLEDMDMSEFQDGATYPQIKEYVLEHTGLKVSNLYISQIKRKCGIEVGKNYNLPKSEDSRQPQCPPEKEKAIREAFNYFGMI